VQIGRQGDAGGLADAVDLAGEAVRAVMPCRPSRWCLMEVVEVAQQVAPSDKSGRGKLIKTV
jgi:hypothetical protein